MNLTFAEKFVLIAVIIAFMAGILGGCSPKMVGTKTTKNCGAWHPKKFKA